MYEFILWMCLLTQPQCNYWQAAQHKVLIFKETSKDECEQAWLKSLETPDPNWLKSRYLCQPITEPL